MRLRILIALILSSSSCGTESHQDNDSIARKNAAGTGVDGRADILPGEPEASSGGAKDVSSVAAPKPDSTAETEEGQESYGMGQLTAGSFDDTLNFEHFKKFWQDQKQAQNLQDSGFPALESIQAKQRLAGVKPEQVEISFVVDTTGSMGDELRFVTGELTGLAESIKEKYPDLPIRWSSVLYRDKGDQYVSKRFDFTESVEDLNTFLQKQSADGGGDMPEAMDVGLAEANSLQWGGEAVAKIVFLIADAPAHRENYDQTFKTLNEIAQKNVKLYPIAASGVDESAEKIMRYGAVVSGGEYIFLTDDSGIGNAHAEPHIPCYQVRKLNKIISQKIEEEISLTRIEVGEGDVLRTVGKQEQGVCKE